MPMPMPTALNTNANKHITKLPHIATTNTLTTNTLTTNTTNTTISVQPDQLDIEDIQGVEDPQERLVIVDILGKRALRARRALPAKQATQAIQATQATQAKQATQVKPVLPDPRYGHTLPVRILPILRVLPEYLHCVYKVPITTVNRWG